MDTKTEALYQKGHDSSSMSALIAVSRLPPPLGATALPLPAPPLAPLPPPFRSENRGPIAERARLIVDVGADRGFAVAAAIGRDRLTVAGAAAGSIATAVRHELDVVRDDLGGMALLAVLAFPLAKGQLAEDNYSLALLQPLLGRLRRLAEAQAVVPVGDLAVFLAAVHRDRELHALGL